jgi:hypothetical protein
MMPIEHIFVCGATRSGKSEAELSRLVPLAKANDCAIVLLDPPGTLASKLLLHLDACGLTRRVIYDRLADTDRVPGYDWLAQSAHPDSLQREAENDERIREFAAILLHRRGMQDTAKTPLIEEGLLAALRLYLHQRTPVPLFWLADIFTPGSDARKHLLANCTEPSVVRKFQMYAALSPTARRNDTAPAERILRAVCESPSFRVRSGGATVYLDRFLDDNGILILDGSSWGNLSRDAASIMMGAIALRVMQHCRIGSKSKVVLVLDEAVNANLVGLRESQAIAEAAKWGLEFHVIVQDPFNFPNEEIRNNVLQNCGRHEWFRQGSPAAARLASEDIGTPILDPLKVHHTEYRIRTTDAGFERIQTTARGEWFDPGGRTRGRNTNWNTVLWPRRREVADPQPRYTDLADQIVLIQKELMLLKPGYRLVRSATVTTEPEYIPMLMHPWLEMDNLQQTLARPPVPRLSELEFDKILAVLKRRDLHGLPRHRPPVSSATPLTQGAAAKLASQSER